MFRITPQYLPFSASFAAHGICSRSRATAARARRRSGAGLAGPPEGRDAGAAQDAGGPSAGPRGGEAGGAAPAAAKRGEAPPAIALARPQAAFPPFVSGASPRQPAPHGYIAFDSPEQARARRRSDAGAGDAGARSLRPEGSRSWRQGGAGDSAYETSPLAASAPGAGPAVANAAAAAAQAPLPALRPIAPLCGPEPPAPVPDFPRRAPPPIAPRPELSASPPGLTYVLLIGDIVRDRALPHPQERLSRRVSSMNYGGYSTPAYGQAHGQAPLQAPSSVFSAAQAWNATHGAANQYPAAARYGAPLQGPGSLHNSVGAISSRSMGWDAAPAPQDPFAAARARAQSAFDPSSRFDFAGANGGDRVRIANMQEEIRDKDAEINRLRSELDTYGRERGSTEQIRARCTELEVENARLRDEAARARELAMRQEHAMSQYENRTRALEAELDALRRGGAVAPMGYDAPPPGVGGVPFGVQRGMPAPAADFNNFASPRNMPTVFEDGQMQTFYSPQHQQQGPPPPQHQSRDFFPSSMMAGGVAQPEKTVFEKLLSVFDSDDEGKKADKRRHSLGAIPAPAPRQMPVGYGGGFSGGAAGYGAEAFFAEGRSQDAAYASDYGTGQTEAFLSRQNSQRRGGGGGAAVSIAPGTTINRDPRTGLLLPKPLESYSFGKQPNPMANMPMY
eukprot:tig00000405_g459.t1